MICKLDLSFVQETSLSNFLESLEYFILDFCFPTVFFKTVTTPRKPTRKSICVLKAFRAACNKKINTGDSKHF